MKSLLTILLLMGASFYCKSQSISERIKQKVNNRVNTNIDRGIDKGLDETENKAVEAGKGITKKKKKDKKKSEENDVDGGKVEEAGGMDDVASDNSISSSSDFVAGGTVIFQDNFSNDPVGDFPVSWNTNGSGEVVTIGKQNTKWFQVKHNSIINPVLKKSLPENYTIQFDLFLRTQGSNKVPFIQFGLTPVKDILKEDIFYKEFFFMNITRYDEKDGQTVEYGLNGNVIGKKDFNLLKYNNKVLHIDMAINKTRLRVYFDGEKLIDLPRVLTTTMRTNFFINNNYVIPASQVGMYVGNISIATGEADARSLLIKQLMENGSASTNEILFETNSAKLQEPSFEIINQLGEAMQNDAGLKIKITGHTDGDGTVPANQKLSEARAQAVKKYLMDQFSISASRISANGKGETQPVESNATAEGKAKNRRVEFTKL